MQVTPAPHYHVDRVLVDGRLVTLKNGAYTFTYVGAAHRLQAYFALDAYTITPSVLGGLLGHGTISPTLPATYIWGSTPTFRFTPAPGYAVFDVTVDGHSVLGSLAPRRASYTFPPLTGPHTIQVRYVKAYVPAPQ